MGKEMLLEWYRDRFSDMRGTIKQLLNSPAKYLDSELTAEPSSGKTLYGRYRSFCDAFREDFPEDAHRMPTSVYEQDTKGTLRRQDLMDLDQDIRVLQAIIQVNFSSN